MGDNGYPDWGRRHWPPGLRQLLHPAAQTAEMEIGGGGRERRRRGRGARSRGGGEELERESWERGDGGGAAGEGGERAQSPEPGRVSGGSVTGAVGHGGGPPFLTLCQLPPSPDVLAQTCPLSPPNPPASSRGHSRKHSLAQQSKATGFSYFPLDKGSAEPGKRGLQRGWSEGQSGRGNPSTPTPYLHTHNLVPPRYPKFCPVFLTSIPTLPPPHPQKKFLRVGGPEVEFPRKSFQDSSLRNTKPLYSPPLLPQNNS